MMVNRQRKVRVATGKLEEFLGEALRETGQGDAEVTVCFVRDAEMAQMNKRYRKKQGSTDVLSFPGEVNGSKADRGGLAARRLMRARKVHAENSQPQGRFYLGDIAIAPDTARRYARKNGRSLESELRVLILHGVLHLLGYDHESDHGEMDRIEQKLRRRLGLS
ncbi:MAG TPA: rRNA maturation RNase YbeY [Candidatus Acidoferrum sp.]|nr:rRNA maturation RNase YbeY [Candidatus Acidoferrum sp.]